MLATKSSENGTSTTGVSGSKPLSSSRPGISGTGSGKHLVSDVPLSVFTASTAVASHDDQHDLDLELEKQDLGRMRDGRM